jgi:hypothetical protein
LLVAAIVASGLAPALADAAWVIAGGKEAALERLLGQGMELAGCRYDAAVIDKDTIQATYQCGGVPQQVVLRHQTAEVQGGQLAGPWRIATSHAALAAALQSRLAAEPDSGLWQDISPHIVPPASATPTADGKALPQLPPDIERRYRATDAAMQADRGWEMYDEIVALVRQNPHPVLMGRLVVACAAIASHPDGQAKVDALIADADASPQDPLKHFIAGVAVHYRGHVRGESKEQKQAEYREALRLLEPLRTVYADSPRLWIYLAVSYVRTGQQDKAEAAIAEALRFDEKTDADVYYCEAEVWHKKDPKRALQAIGKYQKLMRDEQPNGAWHGAGKDAKVEHMRQVMERVVAGEPLPAGDMYDPVLSNAAAAETASLDLPVAGAVGMGLIAAVVGVVWLRRRRVSN